MYAKYPLQIMYAITYTNFVYSCQLANLYYDHWESEKTKNDCHQENEKQKQKTGLKEN